MQKLLELFGFDQFLQKLFFRLGFERFGINKLLPNLLAQPLLFFFALNMTVFDADFSALGAAQNA